MSQLVLSQVATGAAAGGGVDGAELLSPLPPQAEMEKNRDTQRIFRQTGAA